jgi:predicted thioesterase
MTASIEHTVREQDTAQAWGNELPVLATPMLLWLAEIACMRATDGELDDGQMTLGLAHASEHLAPTPLGDTVTITASLREAGESRLAFDVSAADSEDTVLKGTHDRGIVDSERFGKHVEKKSARLSVGSAVGADA